MNTNKMGKIFRQMYKKHSHFITPNLLGYYHVGSLICEISIGQVNRKRVYGVTVIELPCNIYGALPSNLSKRFDSYSEALAYLNIAAATHLIASP